MPPAVLESWTQSWESKMSHISCPIHPNHLLNWLWTSAQLSRFTGYLCIRELLHWLCCWTPSVHVCVRACVCSPTLSALPDVFMWKCVWSFLVEDIKHTHTLSLTLLLICSQDSGGGLGSVEEEPGRRGWGSPKVLLKGNSSRFSTPLISCPCLKLCSCISVKIQREALLTLFWSPCLLSSTQPVYQLYRR